MAWTLTILFLHALALCPFLTYSVSLAQLNWSSVSVCYLDRDWESVPHIHIYNLSHHSSISTGLLLMPGISHLEMKDELGACSTLTALPSSWRKVWTEQRKSLRGNENRMFRLSAPFWSDEKVAVSFKKHLYSQREQGTLGSLGIKNFILRYFLHVIALDQTSIFICISLLL